MRQKPTFEEWEAAAAEIGCEINALKAIAVVESSATGAFFPEPHPSVLFERHLFHRFTDGAWDDVAPDLSHPKAGGYGKYRSQPERLQRARELDNDAAVKATSWGLFQVLGANWKMCGFDSLEDFEARMRQDVGQHLRACVGFIIATPKARRALIEKDWRRFKIAYNGGGKANADYPHRMAMAYARLSRVE